MILAPGNAYLFSTVHPPSNLCPRQCASINWTTLLLNITTTLNLVNGSITQAVGSPTMPMVFESNVVTKNYPLQRNKEKKEVRYSSQSLPLGGSWPLKLPCCPHTIPGYELTVTGRHQSYVPIVPGTSVLGL